MLYSVLAMLPFFIGILGLGALGGLFSERVGIINIAINGMMIFGAICYTTLAKFNSTPGMQIVMLLISGFITGIFAMLHGFATIKLKANHIISGTAINLLAPAIAILIMKMFGDSNKIIVELRDLSLWDPKLKASPKALVSLSLFLTIVIFAVAWFMLSKTSWGLKLKSVGENPSAADSVGVNVNLYKYQGVFISGFLAGIAGAIFAQYAGSFIGNVRGVGFLSLAILIISQWRSKWIIPVTILFAILYSSSYAIANVGGVKFLDDYKELWPAVPYFLTILSLILTSKRSLAPKAIGLHYDKSKR